MRAVLCKEYGPPNTLVVDEVEPRALEEGEVRVNVEACGVNFPDTLIIEGKYQFKPEPPFSPGGEVAGTIAEVGPGVKGVEAGDAVIAMTGWGGFAEQVVVPAAKLLKRPKEMDVVKAAGFSMTYGTSYHALKQRADIQPGETLLVLGASGGVGLAAVELGKAMGARVIAAASSDEKLEVAKKHGADDLVNYSDGQFKDKVKELTGGKGVDVIYDPVGTNALFDQCLRSVGWKGRVLVIGFAGGEIPKAAVNLTLLKGSSIVGVFWGDFARREPEVNAQNFKELFEMYMSGTIDPHVSKTYKLDEAAQALEDLTSRKAVGKLVLTP